MHRAPWLALTTVKAVANVQAGCAPAVLGANDGIASTASLTLGVTAANVARGELLLAGVAGLVAGAMSMAAGEYVSASRSAGATAAGRGVLTSGMKAHTVFCLADARLKFAHFFAVRWDSI